MKIFNKKNKSKTGRGFDIYDFVDLYNQECSLQKSSIADQDCIWIGGDNVHRHMGETTNTRMHLTREMAKQIGEKLIEFSKTGEI